MIYYQRKTNNSVNPKIFALFAVLILFAAIPVTVLFTRNQVQFQQQAWSTTQSAKSICIAQAASIKVTFSNTESRRGMKVTVKDVQTNKSVDLGTVNAGETKTGTIDTEFSKLNKGSVIFFLNWATPPTGSDTRSANYDSINCVSPTPTPTPSGCSFQKICPSCGPIRDEKNKRDQDITSCLLPCRLILVCPSVTPTPSVCKPPEPVKDIDVSCPNCSNQP